MTDKQRFGSRAPDGALLADKLKRVSPNGAQHTPDDGPLARVLNRLDSPKRQRNGNWLADCPNCADNGRRPNLSVTQGRDGRALLRCFALCDNEDIVKSLGLEMRDLFPSANGNKATLPAGLGDETKWPVVARYTYTDAYGNDLCQVRRKEPAGYEGHGFKTFRQFTKSGDGWKPGLDVPNGKRVLYRLPQLYTSHPDQWVFIVEGEKSADRVAQVGLVVTSSLSGAVASKALWENGHYPKQLMGRRIAIVADNDDAGREFASIVKAAMLEHGDPADLRVVYELPGLAAKQDIFDWLELGNTRGELLELVEQSRDETSGPWELRGLADAYREKPPREYLVDGVLPLPSLSILYGFPGDLKSMLVLDLACCVAAGKPWLTGLPGQDAPEFAHYEVNSNTWELEDPKPVKAYDCKRSAVLWLDIDNGLDRTERRIEALGKAHGLTPDAHTFKYLSFPSPPFLGDDADKVEMLTALALQTNSKLIVVDNLLAVSGTADENSSQIGATMAGLRHIAEHAGAAVVVIHHRTKGKTDRAGNALRGHSSIEGSVDLALKVDRNVTDDSEVSLLATKSRDTLVKPFGALWCYRSNGNELIRARFFGTGSIVTKAVNSDEKAHSAVLEHFTPGDKVTAREIIDLCADKGIAGESMARTAIKKLCDDGSLKLQSERGQANAKIYLVC